MDARPDPIALSVRNDARKRTMTRVQTPGEPMISPAGLTSAEARRRFEEFGPNAVAEDTRSVARTLLAKFWAPVPWLLEAAIVLQVWLGQ